MRTWYRLGIAAVCLCIFLGTAATESAVADEQFRRDCVELTKGDHRLAGTPEGLAASRYVEKRLREIGVDEVVVQKFPSAQARVKRCELVFPGGRKLNLVPMRPDGIIPPVTPPDGITGRLVYAGSGRMEDFARTSVENMIVVMDYNCGRGWLRAFRLGAQAVIFVPNGRAESKHSHYVEADANLLRFYFAGSREDLPIGSEATIHSEVVWEGVAGRNVYGFIRGTDPVFYQELEEIIILAADIDSFGEVPHLSPGARGAANCAGLLEIAARLKEKRPRRHILLAFFDGQARGHAGSYAFYRAIEVKVKEAALKARRERFDEEWTFVQKLKSLLDSDQPLDVERSSVRRGLMIRLSEKAAESAYLVRDLLYELRVEARELSKEGTEEAKARIREIQDSVINKWEPDKKYWNDLRRALGRQDTSKITPEVEERLLKTLEAVQRDVDERRVELDLEKRALEADEALDKICGPRWIVVHMSLLLGDTSPHWGLVMGGESGFHSSQDTAGLYVKIQTTFLRAWQGMEKKGSAPKHFVTESADGSLSQTRVLWAAPFLVHSGEPGGLVGIYSLALATCQENLPREGTPDDTIANLDLDRIEAQVAEIGRLLSAVADEDGLSLKRGIARRARYKTAEFDNGRAQGPMVMGVLAGTAVPNTPMAGAIARFQYGFGEWLSYNDQKPYAFDNFTLIRTNQNGIYEIGPIERVWWQVKGFAVVFDERGLAAASSDQMSGSIRLNVFDCRYGAVALPPQYRSRKSAGDSGRPERIVNVLEARSNAELDPSKSFVNTNDGVAYWYVDDKVDGVKLFGLRTMVGLVNGGISLKKKIPGLGAAGEGFPTDKHFAPIRSSDRAATDLWRLNEERIDVLRAKDLMESSLGELHGRAEDLLAESQRVESPVRREALAAAAFLAEQTVYNKSRGMLDDLVFAVLILLGLCVPFAFSLERLLIGATLIYHRVGWFASFFLLTFVVLYLSHPAFAVANTPVIIFLGFAIVVLSSLVIFIIMRKFEVELKALQGMMATVHAADVSRISTLMAAVSMGISTMRRRPLRTALTATTVILLTFTILCFASFGTKTGVLRLFVDANPRYSGVWLHQVNWNAMSADLLDIIVGRWGSRVEVYPRWWISPKKKEQPGFVVTCPDGSRPIVLSGILGLEEEELRQRDDLSQVMGKELAGRVLLTSSVAKALDVKKGGKVLVKGMPFSVGIVDAARSSILTDMDGNSVLPVDFTVMEGQQQAKDDMPEEDPLTAQRNWSSLSPDSVAVVSADSAVALGASLHAVMIYTDDTAQAGEISEDMARMLPLPVAATRTDGVYRHVLGPVLAASGGADLLFPILLGGLVIFGTMLGSVADREREIYTFSALGLAPGHVAMLFFAEAAVYSVVGGMGGYLIAQGSVKILSVLAGYGLVHPPEMNMSSTNAIVTILLVMGTVLVSAIYPAVKSSKSANPGLMRAWRPPPPKGDILELVFPFTVSSYDITGVASFLKEHFDNFSETGLGCFMARDSRLDRAEEGGLCVTSFITLAPFDLGVSQKFELRSVPSEIAGINEIVIHLERASGQPKDWRRLNKVFLDDLRQQFLIWRSIDKEIMETYRSRTLTSLGGEGEEV